MYCVRFQNALSKNYPHDTQPINHLEDDVDECEETNIALMTEDFDKNEILVVEASKSAVIDTACIKTVTGEKWYQNFKTNLPKHSITQIKSFPSETIFRYKDGSKVKSRKV